MRAWGEGWWEMAAETGDLLAPLLGVRPGAVSMHQNVAVAAAIFLSCIDYPAERNRIVYTGLNFPNVMYLLEGEQQEGGGDRHRPLGRRHRRPHRAAAGGHRRADAAGADLPHPLPQRLRAGRRGDRPPLPRGGGGPAARRLPVDRRGAAGAARPGGCTRAMGGSVKWLCGGPGAGYLWVNPEIAGSLRAVLHRLAGGRGALRLPSRPDPLPRRSRPGASSPARRTSRPSTPAAPATRSWPAWARRRSASAPSPSPTT